MIRRRHRTRAVEGSRRIIRRKTSAEKLKYADNTHLRMIKLPQDFFTQRADIVARGLLGRDLMLLAPSGRLVKARLREVAAYQGVAKTTSKEINHVPGIVSLSYKMRQYLIDICTRQGKEPSCVTLRAADIEWPGGAVEQVRGPGNLARRLGITKETEPWYHCQPIYNSLRLWISGEPAPRGEIRVKDGNAPNCLGMYCF